MIYFLISILFFILLYLIYRLNVYIGKLEMKLQEQINLSQNLMQSMKDIIAEDFLQNDGRLKKFNIQTERHSIFNGVRVEEMNNEI